jgi:hypothetical protein
MYQRGMGESRVWQKGVREGVREKDVPSGNNILTVNALPASIIVVKYLLSDKGA